MDLKVEIVISTLILHARIRSFQSSLIALQAAIVDRDWESATRHCARAMSLPSEVVSGPFAETAVVRPVQLLWKENFSQPV
jgi:hypothetical protein